MWPFDKRQSQKPATFVFTDPEAFFRMQCKYGDTDIQAGKGIAAIVLDAKKEFGTAIAVGRDSDGRQLAVLRIASPDGGFIVSACTPSSEGESLLPDDIVLWVPSPHSSEVAEGFGDSRSGWIGLIRAKVALDMEPFDNSFRLICRYD